MKKTLVYIDGYNLYYGLLKGLPASKWLDLRREFGKSVLVFNPHVAVSEHLKRAATYYAHIPRDLPARCQLPETIPYGKRKDRFIHCPPAWA